MGIPWRGPQIIIIIVLPMHLYNKKSTSRYWLLILLAKAIFSKHLVGHVSLENIAWKWDHQESDVSSGGHLISHRTLSTSRLANYTSPMPHWGGTNTYFPDVKAKLRQASRDLTYGLTTSATVSSWKGQGRASLAYRPILEMAVYQCEKNYFLYHGVCISQ